MTTTNFYKQKLPKDKIVLHHTAGGHNPHNTIAGWDHQAKKIGTAYIIGGKDRLTGSGVFDGTLIEYFPPEYWAHHLGIKETNYNITKASIGIEVCNYGPVIKRGEFFINYVGGVIPEYRVEPLKFRGFDFYHKYTPAQIETLRILLLDLAGKFNIDLHQGLYTLLKNGSKAFEKQTSALNGKPGLWSHTNYRPDKTDVSPQPALIEMILSL